MPLSLDSHGIFFTTLISSLPLLFCPRYNSIYGIFGLVFICREKYVIFLGVENK